MKKRRAQWSSGVCVCAGGGGGGVDPHCCQVVSLGDTLATYYMSRIMRKPDFCLCQNKGKIGCAVTAHLISVFVFATQIVQFLFFLNTKFLAICSCTGRSVSDLIVNPEDRFYRIVAHILVNKFILTWLNFFFD